MFKKAINIVSEKAAFSIIPHREHLAILKGKDTEVVSKALELGKKCYKAVKIMKMNGDVSVDEVAFIDDLIREIELIEKTGGK